MYIKPIERQAVLAILKRFEVKDGVIVYKINFNRSKAGDTAGTWVKNRMHIQVLGERYVSNRVAWVIHHGVDPGVDFEVDHKDRNPLNNSKDNLRLACHGQNQSNTCGRGYHWDKSRNKWQTNIWHANKRTSRRFDTEEEARAYYLETKLKNTGDFCPEEVRQALNALQDAVDKTCSA